MENIAYSIEYDIDGRSQKKEKSNKTACSNSFEYFAIKWYRDISFTIVTALDLSKIVILRYKRIWITMIFFEEISKY